MTSVIRADARCLPIADESVDLVVTSPPYFALRSYRDGGEHYGGQIGDEPTPTAYIDQLLACTREWLRVLKPAGSLWVNLGDKYAGGRSGPQGVTGQRSDRRQAATYAVNARNYSAGVANKSLIGIPWRYAMRCVDELGLILRAEVIWAKPNGLPESVTDRVRRSHETWFHFVTEPHYFASLDDLREPYEGVPQRRFSPRIKDRRAEGRPIAGWDVRWDTPRAGDDPRGKLPGSVWTIPTQPLAVPPSLGVDHFAAFPMEWPRRIIRGWSPAGGVVLDPFGGTGTTALVASSLGRVGISVDLSHDYCRLGHWRTNDRGQIAAAMQVPKPDPVDPSQTSLFEGEAS